MNKQSRKAKFQSIIYNGKWGFKSAFPALRLSGKWIEEAGFKIDETCQINVSKNRLVITKVKTAQHDTKNKNDKSKCKGL